MDIEKIIDVYEKTNSIEEVYEELKYTEFEGISFEEFKKAVDENVNGLSDEELSEITGGVKVFGSDLGIFHWGKWEPLSGGCSVKCPKCGKFTATEARYIFCVVGMAEERRCAECHAYKGYKSQQVHGSTRRWSRR